MEYQEHENVKVKHIENLELQVLLVVDEDTMFIKLVINVYIGM